MFERKGEPMLPRKEFAWRVAKSFALAVCFIAFALWLGILGYHYVAGFGWTDSLLNASMILGGMGPVGVLPNDAAKVFASVYALFSGLAFISIAGIILAPLAHRLIHVFHAVDDDRPDQGP